MNTAIYSPSGGSVGLAFAIPAATVQTVVDQLEQDGRVSRGYLGVQIQPLTKELAESFGLSTEKGALVAGAQDGTPAEKAGLKSGDVITAVNGEPVANARELTRKIGGAEARRQGRDQLSARRQGADRDGRARVPAGRQGGEGGAVASDDGLPQLGLELAPSARAKASPSRPSTPTARRPRRASRKATSSSRSAARRCRSRPTSRPGSRRRTRRARRPCCSASRARRAPASSPSPCRRRAEPYSSAGSDGGLRPAVSFAGLHCYAHTEHTPRCLNQGGPSLVFRDRRRRGAAPLTRR